MTGFKGYAHIDGEVERRTTTAIDTSCPKCHSTKTDRVELENNRRSCFDCGWEWDLLLRQLPSSAQEIAEQKDKQRGLDEAMRGYPGAHPVADFPAVVKDRTKARFDLLPWGPLWTMAEVMTNGATKPGRVAHNWRAGTEWSAYFSAMVRHMSAYQQGEDFEIDPDTGAKTYHLASVMCCAAILLEYQMFGIGTDDRFPAGHPAYQGMKK